MNTSLRSIAFNTLVDLVNSDNNLTLEFKGNINRIRFAPKEFDKIEKAGDGSWDCTNYIILFEIENRPDRLDILLVIGPGKEDIRQKLFDHALQHPEVFRVNGSNLPSKYKRIFRKNLINYKGGFFNEEVLKETIVSVYKDFKEIEYKKIVNYIKYNYNREIPIINQEEVEKDILTNTEKEHLAKVRIGHSDFKRKLIDKECKCKICDVTDKSFLIASHIKPWYQSSNDERLDLDNGFLLCPNHDALFDKGFITFDDNGKIVISNLLNEETRIFLNVTKTMNIEIKEGNRYYLEWHRLHVFKNDYI